MFLTSRIYIFFWSVCIFYGTLTLNTIILNESTTQSPKASSRYTTRTLTITKSVGTSAHQVLHCTKLDQIIASCWQLQQQSVLISAVTKTPRKRTVWNPIIWTNHRLKRKSSTSPMITPDNWPQCKLESVTICAGNSKIEIWMFIFYYRSLIFFIFK